MKKTWLLILLLGLPLLTSCAPPFPTISGSGHVVTRDERISGFDRVDAGHTFRVDVRQGERFGVVVRIDDNLLDYLVLEKQGSTLNIGLEPNRSYRRYTAEAEVTMPELAGLGLSGASQGTVTGFSSGKTLRIRVSGASQLRGDIEAGDTWIEVSGASEMTLKGSADDLDVNASGASVVDLADFSVRDADLDASGASKITVDASGTLNVDASGASMVTYLGSPRMGRVDTSGSSSVRRR